MARLALLVPLLAAVGAAAQQTPQAPQPTFRAKTDLVRLEVIVEDENGQPVRGLTQADFTVIDRRKPQPIALFEEVSSGGRPLPAPVRHAVPPRDVATNASAKASTFIILVVDDMVMRKYYDKTKELAREVVDRFGQTSVMAMLVTSGTDGVEATDDPALIHAAIDRLGAKADRVPEAMGNQVSQPTTAEKNRALSLRYTPELRDDIGCHLSLLQQAALMTMADEAPRKILVYITPFCREENETGSVLLTDELRAAGFRALLHPDSLYTGMIDALRRANVTVYALDPRGELTFGLDQFSQPDRVGIAEPPGFPGRATSLKMNNPVFQSQEGLRTLTAISGGVAVTNSNDFEGGLEQIAQDLSDFYILGFYAPDSRGGEFRAIEVHVNRPGLSVRSRAGYVSGSGPKLKATKDPMVGMAVGALPVGDLPLGLFAAPWPDAKSDKPVLVVVEMTVLRAEMTATPQGLHDDVAVSILAGRTPGAKLVRHVQSKRQIDIARTTAESVTYQVSTVIDLPPASYQLRVSAKSAATGRSGSVYLPVTVPEPASPRFALGGIVLGFVDGARGVSTTAANVRSRLPFSPTLTRTFTSSDSLHALCKLWRRNPAEPVKIFAALVGEKGELLREFDAPVRVGSGARAAENIDIRLNLAGVPPGSYRLRVTAAEGAVSEVREVGIVVKAAS
jgi:VWFA-related protein